METIQEEVGSVVHDVYSVESTHQLVTNGDLPLQPAAGLHHRPLLPILASPLLESSGPPQILTKH